MFGVIPCPCGQCIPCRINRRRIWTHRILLESFMHDKKCFLTLTYDDEHLPKDASLNPRHVQLFLKKMRKELGPGSLRFFCVGEYGGTKYGSSKTSREVNPHYHLALFGFNCCGRIYFAGSGKRCFCEMCEFVRSKWEFGNIVIDELNRKSAQYIARYVVKKLTSFNDSRHEGRYPEFQRSSRRPGIGAGAVDNIFRSLQYGKNKLALSAEGDVPGALSIDGQKLPFGRFILNKLRERADVTEVSRSRYVAELQALWFDALSDSENPPLSLKSVLLQRNSGRVANVEAAYNIYSSEGVL